jgi:hypothetical protein
LKIQGSKEKAVLKQTYGRGMIFWFKKGGKKAEM